MGKQDELDKYSTRGQTPTAAEEELEEAREAWHAAPKGKKIDTQETQAAKARFKTAQEAVRAERLEARTTREGEPVPDGATEVRDANGKVYGWMTPTGDAVAAQGGRAG